MLARIVGLFAIVLKKASPRRIAVVTLGVAAMGIAAIGVMANGPPNGPTGTSKAAESIGTAMPPGRATIAALGRLEPRGEMISVSAPGPDRLQTLLASRGDQVKKDQVLGYLATYDKQVADQAVIAARLEEARAQLRTEIAYGEAALELARIQLRQVQELMPLRIAAQESTVADVEIELSNNKDILESYNSLLERQVSSRRTHENQRALVRQGEEKSKGAQVQLRLLRQQFVLDEANAQAQIVSAESALQRAKAGVAVKSLESLLTSAAASTELTVIRAPIDGTILNVLARPGSPVNGTTILTMGDTSRMRAVAEVYETDVANIRLNQPATVTSAALRSPLKGRVVQVGQMVFKNDVLNVDPAARSDARVVEVRIELEPNALAATLSNLTVDVLIDVRPEREPTIPVSRNDIR